MTPTCENVPQLQPCDLQYNCCDCGNDTDGCGCHYCWSCNACDTCKSDE